MYNNTNQYPPTGYTNPYGQYASYPANYGYQQYGYPVQNPTQNAAGSSGEVYNQANWSQNPNQQTAYAPVPQPQAIQPKGENKKEAVVQEMQQQRATLTKQREDYVKKALVLRRELVQLRQQKQELAGDDRSENDLKAVLKENDRLQDEINSKLKAILNVVEMLSTIIKDGKKFADLEVELEHEEKRLSSRPGGGEYSQESPPPGTNPNQEDEFHFKRDTSEKYCYVYYDTGLHWCRACDEFPETAKEYLQHLQSKKHQEMAKENEVDITPWHKLTAETLLPSYDDAPKKRIPIKGLQFFISAPSWYCKLCDVWIGDLHCASQHLKSQIHFQNFENFVEQNPQWETEWLKDREKAMFRSVKPESSDSDGNRKKKKRKHSTTDKEKKKKKHSKKKKKRFSDSSSSSSSSDSSTDDDKNEDSSKSIRVAMRNMSQVKNIINEDMSKWTALGKLLEDHRKTNESRGASEDDIINQWMTVDPVAEKEKNIIDTLKDRMRAKQELEKAKLAELEKRRREKEKQEQEMQEKKQRLLREEMERYEKEKHRREQEELQRILDKDRSHVKFRTSRDHYKRRKSGSDDEGKSRRRSKEKSPPHHRYRRDKERSRSPNRKDESISKKRPPFKRLPFIGRMPLFKKKSDSKHVEEKEIKKEEYEPQRKTRFESGNLARAFIPKPDVVCFPVLSSVPPIMLPPPPPKLEHVDPPMPKEEQPTTPSENGSTDNSEQSPTTNDKYENQPPVPPSPPPPVANNEQKEFYPKEPAQPVEQNSMEDYYQNYNMMYQSQQYEYQEQIAPPPHPPLEPPPLPPDDDLAMLGICADDMAAQTF